MNPITTEIRQRTFCRETGRDLDLQSLAAIILTMSTFAFVGILYGLFFWEIFVFKNENRQYFIYEDQGHYHLPQTEPMMHERIRYHILLFLNKFKMFCLTWFHFCMLLLPPILYTTCTGLRLQVFWYLFPFVQFCQKTIELNCNLRTDFFEMS